MNVPPVPPKSPRHEHRQINPLSTRKDTPQTNKPTSPKYDPPAGSSATRQIRFVDQHSVNPAGLKTPAKQMKYGNLAYPPISITTPSKELVELKKVEPPKEHRTPPKVSPIQLPQPERPLPPLPPSATTWVFGKLRSSPRVTKRKSVPSPLDIVPLDTDSSDWSDTFVKATSTPRQTRRGDLSKYQERGLKVQEVADFLKLGAESTPSPQTQKSRTPKLDTDRKNITSPRRQRTLYEELEDAVKVRGVDMTRVEASLDVSTTSYHASLPANQLTISRMVYVSTPKSEESSRAPTPSPMTPRPVRGYRSPEIGQGQVDRLSEQFDELLRDLNKFGELQKILPKPTESAHRTSAPVRDRGNDDWKAKLRASAERHPVRVPETDIGSANYSRRNHLVSSANLAHAKSVKVQIETTPLFSSSITFSPDTINPSIPPQEFPKTITRSETSTPVRETQPTRLDPSKRAQSHGALDTLKRSTCVDPERFFPSGRSFEPVRKHASPQSTVHGPPQLFKAHTGGPPDVERLRKALKPTRTGDKIRQTVEMFEQKAISVSTSAHHPHREIAC